jgi:hypothetical protein
LAALMHASCNTVVKKAKLELVTLGAIVFHWYGLSNTGVFGPSHPVRRGSPWP